MEAEGEAVARQDVADLMDPRGWIVPNHRDSFKLEIPYTGSSAIASFSTRARLRSTASRAGPAELHPLATPSDRHRIVGVEARAADLDHPGCLPRQRSRDPTVRHARLIIVQGQSTPGITGGLPNPLARPSASQRSGTL